MKVILVYLGDLLHCPPAMSLGKIIDDLGYECRFVTYADKSDEFTEYFSRLAKVEFVSVGASNTRGDSVKKFCRFWGVRRNLWKIIDLLYDKESVIWVVSNGTLKYFGKKLLNKKYILHLLELTEELYFIESKHLLPLSRRYIENAADIIECEYNRAHITKAWWGLNKLPSILQNKPYISNPIEKNNKITSNASIERIIEEISDRKIILYQGNISKERPLDSFIEAVSELGEEFAFVAMVNGQNPYRGKSKNYYYIPFVKPPYHLEITSHAYIGILSYTPIKNSYSILNTVYCAPNKIWEYSRFSVPMISNDLPALKYHFDKYKDGIAIENWNKQSIKEAIEKIDKSYVDYAHNAKKMFDAYDIKDEVHKILKRIE